MWLQSQRAAREPAALEALPNRSMVSRCSDERYCQYFAMRGEAEPTSSGPHPGSWAQLETTSAHELSSVHERDVLGHTTNPTFDLGAPRHCSSDAAVAI